MTTVRERPAEDPWAAVVESSADAIIVKDLDGVIWSWNRAAEKLFGYTVAEVIRQPITLIFPPDRAAEEKAYSTELDVVSRSIVTKRIVAAKTARTSEWP